MYTYIYIYIDVMCWRLGELQRGAGKLELKTPLARAERPQCCDNIAYLPAVKMNKMVGLAEECFLSTEHKHSSVVSS
jgi:hypothetical protein